MVPQDSASEPRYECIIKAQDKQQRQDSKDCRIVARHEAFFYAVKVHHRIDCRKNADNSNDVGNRLTLDSYE